MSAMERPQRLPPVLTVSFTENKRISLSPKWTYSPILEKLFCKNVSPVTFNLRTSEPIPPGSQLLAAAWTDGVIVGRCPNHQVNRAKEVQLFDTDPSRFIVAENSCYLKKEDGAEYIAFPIGDGMSCNFSVILYFMCFSSCLKLQRGKELRLQLKIENNGREICRAAVQMRVCPCPGRDRNTLEGKQQAGDGEEQGGSSPPTPLNVGKRSFSDVAADDTDADIIRHQIFIEGPGPAVKQCIARLVDETKAGDGEEQGWFSSPNQDEVTDTGTAEATRKILEDQDGVTDTGTAEATRKILEGMSRRDRRALERGLKKGQKSIRHGRIIFIGPGRSGKSALIRSMLNKTFQHTNSTIGIEVGKVRCVSRFTEESLRFEEQKEEVFQQKVRMAYDAILDIIEQEKKCMGPVASDIQLQAAASPSVAGDQRRSQEDQDTAPEFTPLLESEFEEEIQCAKDVLKAFIDELRSHNALEEDILEAFWHFDLWDFAGQKPFEALQHMFLSSARCAYLIVFDATKLLEGRYHDEFCDSSGESHDGNVEGCSYFRAFESWLHIVQQVAGDDVDVPVYAVGTHIDVFDATVRQEELRKVEDRIWKVAEKRAYFLNLRKVFFVNNTKSGSEQEDPEIGVLRQELVTSMESQCSVPIPISWMPFAPVLDAITQQVHMRILPLHRVRQIAREACQDEAVDVDGLLAYHHHLGQIVQCRSGEDSSPPGSLPQAPVIIDTNWLVQAAASLFTPEPLKSRAPRFRPEYKLLFDEGILLESLAIHRWSQSELTKDLAENASQRQVVLTLLSQFDLLYSSQSEDAPASAPDRKYIVPALVNRPADLQHSLSYHTRTPSYYIVCGKLQLFPQILFWCSLVRLMKGFNIGTQVLLFKNRARLLSSSGYWLEMTLFDSGIRLTIEGEEDDVQKLAGVCRQVVDLLSRDLLALRSVSLRHVELFQAVRCECTSGDRPCREHHTERCQNISCFHFARLPLCADPKYSSDPPVFRCPLDALPRAVVDNQAEMQHYWLPDGSKVGITPEQSRGPAPRHIWEPSRLPPEENLAGSMQSLPMERASQARTGNPWKTEEYWSNRIQLIRRMHPTQMKRACLSLGLMSEYDNEDVDEKTKRTDKNEEILKVMERSADKFGEFREVLHTVRDCREVARELDAVGPDRDTDADCLRAKSVLEKSDS